MLPWVKKVTSHDMWPVSVNNNDPRDEPDLTRRDWGRVQSEDNGLRPKRRPLMVNKLQIGLQYYSTVRVTHGYCLNITHRHLNCSPHTLLPFHTFPQSVITHSVWASQTLLWFHSMLSASVSRLNSPTHTHRHTRPNHNVILLITFLSGSTWCGCFAVWTRSAPPGPVLIRTGSTTAPFWPPVSH